MSGPKPYTMREMKGVVEYLVEHKAYSEYRGRKMWMDFANTSLTTRTWQSLKETFLKRILPDIQNPYYRLTRDQVCSFKQGTDVEAKEKNNKLEIRLVDEESSNNAENQKEIEELSANAEKVDETEKTLGENIQSATITVRNRSSADTYILDVDTSQSEQVSNKKTTEELLAELEDSPKPLKEYLTFEYSEPPSVVREVLDDFETESESSDKEPSMKIVEDRQETVNTDNVEQEVIVIEDTQNMDNVEYIEEERITVEGGMEVDIGPTFDHEIVTEVTTTEIQGVALNNWLEDVQEEQEIPAEGNAGDEADDLQETTTASKDVDDAGKIESHNETETVAIEDSEDLAEIPKEKEKKSVDNDNNNQTSLSTTSDTIIPNNQEVLNTEEIKSQKSNGKFDILAPLKDAASRKRSTSQDKTLNKKPKLDNGIESKTNGDANVEKSPPSSNNTEALFDALKKTDNPVNGNTLQDAQDVDESPQVKNPCLKSVSLFEEQFNTTKYSDTDEETPIPNNKEKITDKTLKETLNEESNKIEEATNALKVKPSSDKNEEIVQLENQQNTTAQTDPPIGKQEKVVKTNNPEDNHSKTLDSSVKKKRDVIILNSNSDSDSEITRQTGPPKEKFKHLAKAFGFVPGTSITAAQRRRSLRSRNRTRSQLNSCTHHELSDWEGSVSEPELAEGYVSPPRGRRNRHARKYKKPQSGRIMSLDEEGGLFVVHGNKIIPLVKNGKTLTFVTYDSLGCSEEEEELIWRQKYIDEKKKAAELKKQLEEANTSRSKSPILQNPLRKVSSVSSAINTVQKPTETDANNQMQIKQIGDAGKIQITLSKNEEKINLEGHWPQVLPMVQQIMNMFYKPEETGPELASLKKEVDNSGLVTPIIPVIDLATQSKVDDLESKIFKEIEEQDKKENTVDTNVTKRKPGRPKKTLSTSSEKSEKLEKLTKRPRRSKQAEQNDKTANTTEDKTKKADHEDGEKLKVVEKPTEIHIEGDKLSVEETGSEVPKNVPAKDKQATKRKIVEAENKMAAKGEETDNEMLEPGAIAPVPRVTRSRKSGNDTDSSTRTVTTRLSAKPKDDPDEDIRYMLPPVPKTRKSTSKLSPYLARSSEHPHTTLQDRLITSIDSTQGYQDSDASPAKVNATKRKKKVSVTVRKGKYVPRRRSLPTLSSIHDAYLESSNSSYFIPIKPKSHSTLDSAVYKTESYQILMGNRKLSIKKLDVIDETSKSDDLGHFNVVSKDSSDNSNIVIELGSSSNVSLPLSPELSVVENLSISREMITSENHPTINETQANNSVIDNIYNQYLISEMDVSVPLMQQDCELLNTQEPAKSKVKKHKTPVKLSGLLNKVCTVNMSVNNTLSDSLDRKLRDLLLESAQKISDTNKENLMDIDETNVEKKTRGKKRCSTPRKRTKATKKPKPTIGPVIDEHMESCSQAGRNSCPPAITFLPVDENANNSADVQLKTKPKSKQASKARAKNIIRVKIQRPSYAKSKDIPETSANTSQLSVYTDSGINETASISGFLRVSDSVELIHNHSETCLQANECIGDSIEFVENSKSESVISINSTASLESLSLKVMDDEVNVSSGNRGRAQETSGEKTPGDVYGTPTDTVYHSPIASNCSLLTDDLSDDAPIPPTKWYLLSEDDTNNTNMPPEKITSNIRVSNFSANLKRLFPITCAVPDLSTISEISKENESSRKCFNIDGDTRSSDYQSLL